MNSVVPISKISGRDLYLKKDKATRKNIEALKECGRAIDHQSDWLYGELDIPINKKRRFAANILNSLVPARFRDYLPAPLAEFVAEESHVSYFMETHLRDNVNNVMGVVKNLVRSAQHEEEQLDSLMEDTETAEKENWDLRRLQEHIARLANINIDQEIQDLLGEKSDLLTEKDKEKRRIDLLKRLRANTAGRKKLVEAHGKICSIGLEVLESGLFQYFDFLTVVRPLRVIEGAAKDLVDMDKSIYAAKDVVIMMAKLSATALGHVADATARVHAYAISSPDTSALLESVNRHLDEKLQMLDETRKQILFLDEERQKKIAAPPLTEEQIEDAVVVEAKTA